MIPLAFRLRRLWWVPLLVILAGDLWFLLFFQAGLSGLVLNRQALAYVPFVLHLVPRLALFAVVWPRLREGGPFQTLIAGQAALPLVFFALSRFLMPLLVARGLLGGLGLQVLVAYAPTLLELGCLAGAFRLRTADAQEGELGVAASTGLALLGSGELALGLAPLLALAFRDPLLEEFSEGKASRASFAAFLSILALPVGALLRIFIFRGGLGWNGGVAFLQVPALIGAALGWLHVARRLGPEGRIWRVLTYLTLALAVLAGVAFLLLLLAFRGVH